MSFESAGLKLVDPSLVGSPIEDLLRLPVSDMRSFEPGRYLNQRELVAVSRHRIVPLVDESWIEPELRDEFRATRRQVALLQMALEVELQAVVETLASAGIDLRVLKGLATGALDYSERGMRQTGDIDLLVRPERVADSVDALIQNGAASLSVEGSIDPLLLKGSTVVTANKIEVDLHSRLSRYSHQNVSVLMGDPEESSAGWLAPGPELRLIHAAGHLVWTPFGHRRLSGLVDIGVVLDSGVDLGAVLRLANEVGLAGIVGCGLQIEANIRARGQSHLVGWPPPSGLQRRAFLGEERSVFFEHALALRHLTTWPDRWQYLRHFLSPPEDHVARSGGRAAHFSRLMPSGLRRSG